MSRFFYQNHLILATIRGNIVNTYYIRTKPRLKGGYTMKKGLSILILLSICFSCIKGKKYALPESFPREESTSVSLNSFYKNEIDAITKIIRSVAMKYFKENVAIFPFVKGNKYILEIAQKIFTKTLDAADEEFKVISPKKVLEKISLARISPEYYGDEEKLAAFARKQLYQIIVFADFTKIGEQRKLIIKIMDSETEAVLKRIIYLFSEDAFNNIK